MQNNKTKVALIYDFDETLSTQYMQDFCLIPQFGMTPDEFWAKANQWSRENGADQVTGQRNGHSPDERKSEGMRERRDLFSRRSGMV